MFRVNRTGGRACATVTCSRWKAGSFRSFSAGRTAASTVNRIYKIPIAKDDDSFRFLLSSVSPLFRIVLYDIGSPKARAENQELKININLNKRSLSTRLWEIRISQIPFSSKAPSGCMQYFTGSEGKYLLLSLMACVMCDAVVWSHPNLPVKRLLIVTNFSLFLSHTRFRHHTNIQLRRQWAASGEPALPIVRSAGEGQVQHSVRAVQRSVVQNRSNA